MPLAGFPSDDLYPSSDLFPGVAGVRAVFRTPTQDVAYRMEGNLFARLPHALSVWLIDGVWHEGFAPSADIVDAADRYYQGGYEHPIDTDQLAELINGGYAAYITVLEVLP